MLRRNSLTFVVLLVGWSTATVGAQQPPQQRTDPLKGVLLAADQVTQERLRSLTAAGTNAVVIELRGSDAQSSDAQPRKRESRAAKRVQESGLALYYWIEVARCRELADAHLDWMASLQGHQEWRRFFQDAPMPTSGEVIKTYPWVPILSKEAFQAQLQRVRRLLRDQPNAKGVFLNDLQGAPSACGCGNPLCRWTGDYGKIRTATPLGDEAAASFVTAVAKFVPGSAVIPVWTTECEEHDGVPDGLCAGVGCYQGIC